MAVKPTKIEADPIKTFMHAERFLRADIYLRKNDDFNHMHAIALPSMVISSFATELFLKALLTLENGWAPMGHDLDALYSKLSQKTKKRLSECWDDYIQSPKEIELRRFMEEHSSTPLPSSLAEAIEASATAFEKLRYVHENEMDSQRFYISNFPLILRKVILELYPDVEARIRILPTIQPR